MPDYTFEGKTRQPVYPTSALVDYTPLFVASNDTGATWKNPAAANEITPVANVIYQCLNTNPVKITPDNTNKYVTLLPGVWRARVEIHGKSGAAVVEPRVAVCDAAATANTFFEYDADGDSLVGATKEADLTLSGLIAISVPTNIRLVVAEATGSGTWTLFTTRMFVRRVCNYVAA